MRHLRKRLLRAAAAVVGVVVAVLVTCAPSMAALAVPLPVKTVTIEKSTANYEIRVVYPGTGFAAIDDTIADWVNEKVAEFRKEEEVISSSNEPVSANLRPPEMDISFSVERNDDKIFVVKFGSFYYTGGAHGDSSTTTFSFLRPDGWRVFLPEIFAGRRALDQISGLAIAELGKKLAGVGIADWIRTGAGPSWANFAAFVLLSEKLVLYFDPYQVASYADGPQTVDIPLVKLAGQMRKDWRAPATSFDCAAARSPTEKAICSDVPLARLDRDVANAFWSALEMARFESATGDAQGKRIRQAQRGWLRHRDTACANKAVEVVACLRGIYRKRLAELEAALR